MHPSQEHVTVEPYTSQWAIRYEAEQALLRATLPRTVRDVQHFGSTSVPGLSAKPTVDILLGTTQWPWPEVHDDALAQAGYVFYKTPNDRWRVYLKPWATMQRGYHLHIVEHHSDHWDSHLLFRDYLRAHPADAARYAALKCDLAARHADRRGTYQQEKGALIQTLMKRPHDWQARSQQ